MMQDAKYGTLREETLPTAFVPTSQEAEPQAIRDLRTARRLGRSDGAYLRR